MSNTTWNTESLKAYIDTRIDDLDTKYAATLLVRDTAVASAFDAATTARDKAEGATNKRFDGMNAFRETLADQQRTFIPRAEMDANVRSLELRMDRIQLDIIKLRESIAENMGRRGLNSEYIAYFIAFISIVVSIAILLLHK